jgi:hypothetical protein
VKLQIQEDTEAAPDKLLNDGRSRRREKLFAHLQPAHRGVEARGQIERACCIAKIECDDYTRLKH